MSTTTDKQAAYLNALHAAVVEMRRANRLLSVQAKTNFEFDQHAPQRADLHAQVVSEAVESVAKVNLLLDLAGAMSVSKEDLERALAAGAGIHFSSN